LEHGYCQLALYHGTNSIINVAMLEGDQLSNQDVAMLEGMYVCQGHTLHTKSKNGKYSYQEEKKETYDGAHRLNRFS
jgi:hypothetical protein